MDAAWSIVSAPDGGGCFGAKGVLQGGGVRDMALYHIPSFALDCKDQHSLEKHPCGVSDQRDLSGPGTVTEYTSNHFGIVAPGVTAKNGTGLPINSWLSQNLN